MFRSPRDALDVLRRLNDCGVNLHVLAWAAASGNGVGKLVFSHRRGRAGPDPRARRQR